MGIVIGLIGSYLMRQKVFGMIGYMVIALIGSFIGGHFVGGNVSITQSLFLNVLITSSIGAIIFLLAIGLFKSTETRNKTA